MADTTTTSPVTHRPRKMAREPKSEIETPNLLASGVETSTKPAAAIKQPTKTSLVLDLLGRSEGASLDQIVEATGWLPHTTRAALTGLKKKGHTITSEKLQGTRRYHIESGAA